MDCYPHLLSIKISNVCSQELSKLCADMQMYVARHSTVFTDKQIQTANRHWESVCAVIDSPKALHMHLQERVTACQEGKSIATGQVEIREATVRTRYLPSARPLQLPEEEEEKAELFLTARFYGEQLICFLLEHTLFIEILVNSLFTGIKIFSYR